MEQKVETQAILNSAEPPTAAELVKLIRKLRWIGLEDEARQLQLALDRFPPDERAVLPSIPTDCD
jgi:hypothetical protein